MDNLVTQVWVHHLCSVSKVDGGTMKDFDWPDIAARLARRVMEYEHHIAKLEAALRKIADYDEHYGGTMIDIAHAALEGSK